MESKAAPSEGKPRGFFMKLVTARFTGKECLKDLLENDSESISSFTGKEWSDDGDGDSDHGEDNGDEDEDDDSGDDGADDSLGLGGSRYMYYWLIIFFYFFIYLSFCHFLGRSHRMWRFPG